MRTKDIISFLQWFSSKYPERVIEYMRSTPSGNVIIETNRHEIISMQQMQ